MGGEVYLAEYGRAKTIHFDLVEVDGVDLRVDAADGGSDCIVMTDEAAEGTATNDFVDRGSGYSLLLTAAEMAGARITVYVIDSATKAWLDKTIQIETFGHLSSAHPFLSPYWTNGAVNDGSASSTVWTFDGFTEATADHVIGSELTFTSGANAGQSRTVTDYTSTVITVSPALLAAPADNDEFVLRAVAQTTLGIGQAPSIGDILADVTGIAGSAMRGTDNAALASVLGALNDAAAAGDPTTNDTAMQYVKQLVNLLAGAAGIGTNPSGTTPADGVNIFEILNGLVDQVASIGTSGGAALNFAAADDNVDGALNGVTFVGVQTSGTFVSTEAEEGTNHVIDDTTNNIDIVYQFNIGGGRTATEVIWKGFLAGAGDSVNIQVYDFVGTDWETQAVIAGKNQSVNETIDFPILSKHTGTGVNIGIVYLRFVVASGSNQTLETDQLIVEAVAIGQSVGYANGQIWVDTVNGTAGTENFVNGTADNAVLTWADALTLSASLGLTDFHIINGSTIQLSAASTNYSLFGDNWTLDLNGQNISDSHFEGAIVSGTGTNTTGEQIFVHCEMGDVTLPTGTHCRECELEGTFTLGEAGIFFFEDCKHGTVSGAAIIDFGSGLNSSTLHMHPYHGGLEIQNMGAGTGTYLLHLNGDGILTFNANCSATSTINIAGNWDITNNASGLTINRNAQLSQDEVNTQADTALTDYAGPTKTEMDTAHALLATPAQVATELGTYDAPTKAEMDTGHGLLATEAKQDIIDTNVDDIETAVITNAAGTDVAADIIEVKTETAAIKAKTDNLPGSVPKNVALANFAFLMVDETDFATPETGLTVTAQISQDGGGFGAMTNSAAEIGNGIYKVSITQAEMNADVIVLKFTATLAAQRTIVLKTDA